MTQFTLGMKVKPHLAHGTRNRLVVGWGLLFLFGTFLAAGAGLVWAEPPPAQQGPDWPLLLPNKFLTSNFMEFRDGRFHTALDLKTNSEIGYAVVAAEDGRVIRLRASYLGYGRAIYLQGKSGRIYVYAHLSRFADRLRPLVREAQQSRGTYSVDLYLEEPEIWVQQGEVIGLTGESGTLGPHLHFEVRNANHEPLNPLRCGFDIPDTLAPQIRKIRVIPVDPTARVAGGLTSRSVNSRSGLRGELPPLEVSGPVVFAAEVLDRSDIQRHRLTPHELEVTLDGGIVFRSSNDSLSFRQNRQMRLEWLEIAGVREKWLYRRPENSLPGRQGEPWSSQDGGLPPGRYEVQVKARDWAGQEAMVWWELHVQEDAQPDSAALVGGWKEDPVRLPLPALADSTRRWLTPFLVLHEGVDSTWTAHEALTYEGPSTDLRQLVGLPDAAGSQTLLWAWADSLDLQEQEELYADQKLRYLGTAVRVLGVDRYNWTNPLVMLPGMDSLPDSLAGAGVYVQRRGGTWSPVESPVVPELTPEGPLWHIPTRAPGRYALCMDAVPPEIGPAEAGELVIWSRQDRMHEGVTMSRWHLLPVRLYDSGAGVDPGTVRIWCDGRELIAEPDFPRLRLLLELPDDLTPGGHELILQAGDYVGNTVVRSLQISCRESS